MICTTFIKHSMILETHHHLVIVEENREINLKRKIIKEVIELQEEELQVEEGHQEE
jgi:hypothetical protein